MLRAIYTSTRVLFMVFLVAAFLAATATVAANQSDYTLDWWTVDGGGETFNTAGSYTLGGTIGQPDAALWQGGSYTLVGGFWGGGAAVAHKIYLPLVLKS